MAQTAPESNHIAAGVTVGVLKERSPGERRVALTPDAITRLHRSGVTAVVESGAGESAWYSDDDYVSAGARIAPAADVLASADAIVCVDAPSTETIGGLRSGQFLIGLLGTRVDPSIAGTLAARGVRAIDLALLPRTLSSAQSMDALTSQANVAGYKSVIVAADAFSRYLPMLMTAAGTVRPAQLLVLGAGVAGLQAMGTARRLGAVVTGYDVRPATRTEVESLGAKFLDLGDSPNGQGEGGYARELTPAEQTAQQEALAAEIGKRDIVITTAQVPGRKPPVLVTASAIERMKAGSVVVDLAASALGGNVDGSRPDVTVVTSNGVTVIGAGNLPSAVPTAASEAYGRNVSDLVAHFVRDGVLRIDASDPIDAAVVVGGASPGGPATEKDSSAPSIGGATDEAAASAPATHHTGADS